MFRLVASFTLCEPRELRAIADALKLGCRLRGDLVVFVDVQKAMRLADTSNHSLRCDPESSDGAVY
jgi:hypothetical protein